MKTKPCNIPTILEVVFFKRGEKGDQNLKIRSRRGLKKGVFATVWGLRVFGEIILQFKMSFREVFNFPQAGAAGKKSVRINV